MSSFIESIESALEKIAAAKDKISELVEQVANGISGSVDKKKEYKGFGYRNHI